MDKEEQIKIYKKMITLLRAWERDYGKSTEIRFTDLLNSGLCNMLVAAYYSIKKKNIPHYLFTKIMRSLWRIAKTNDLLFILYNNYNDAIGRFWFRDGDIRNRIKVLRIVIKELEEKK